MVEIIVTVVSEVAKCLAPQARGPISYLRKYKSNFENLKDEVEKLKDESTRIQRRVDAAERNLEGIEENVEKWLARASNIIKEVAEKFPEDEVTAQKRCCKGLCPDLKTRYQLSKEAVRQREAVIRHREEAGKFDKISYPIIDLQDPRQFNKDYQAFESRKSILMNVISSLSNPDVNVVGIYGMGGVGKTTLAKEVRKQLMDDKLFDPVLFVEVSQRPDRRKIQKEIAEKLGLTLSEEDTESNRRAKLYQRLRNEKKILIILDNIWASLDLENSIGIPLRDDHKGCKVLLTARSVDVLMADPMRCRQNFSVDVLDDEEAWSLFKSKAGHDIEGSGFESVARQVAKKCAGLPVAIAAVASALRNKELYAWKDALGQLSRPSSTKFKNIQKEAYSAIVLSYNLLEDKELKNIFLLIAYTSITSTDDLLMYGVGLGLFEGIRRMEEAQDRVRVLVDKLRASSMLLQDKDDVEDFIVHDVVRDVAISIASTEQHVFANELFDELEWTDENAQKAYSSIVLKDVKTSVLLQALECQQLELLSIAGTSKYSSLKVHDEFFRRMTELRVLVLDCMELLSLPSSICFLTNLRTLGLIYCQLGDIGTIGELKKLEILCLKYSDIRQLPEKVGHLTRLRSLDLRGTKLKVIPANVISSLSHLEELYMGGFHEWEEVGMNKERRNASLDELKHLSKLTCLEIEIKDAKTIPRDLSFQKLERYKISIGRGWNSDGDWAWDWDRSFWSPKSCRKLKLELMDTNICLNDGHIMQLKESEDLCLVGSQDMKNVVWGLDRDGFPQLKYLEVRSNDNLSCVVDSSMEKECVTRNVFPLLESLFLKDLINLKKICGGQVKAESFSKLRKIKLEKCDKLENMFSFSIARAFAQHIQSIEVVDCQNMEAIFAIKREDESDFNSNINSEVIDNIELRQLRSLTLSRLPQLTRFYSKLKTPSPTQHRQERRDEIILEDDSNVFNEKVALPNLESLEMYEINVNGIWQNRVAALSSGIQNLTRLIVSGCCNLRYLFSSCIASSSVRLQHLEVCNCSALEVIVVFDERKDKDVVLPQLKFLKMEALESLTKFCSGYIEFTSLKQLEIMKLPELKGFVVKNISTDLTEIPSPFFNEKAFPILEELTVEAKMMWQFPEEFFCKLKFLGVVFDESNVFLSLDFFQRFHSMKRLTIEGNKSQSIEQAENGMSALIWNLNKCPDLKHILTEKSNMDHLVHLQVYACDHLVNLVPSSTSFQNLISLDLSYCDQLTTIVTSSTAKSLVRLRIMRLSGCNGITEIVAADEGDGAKDDEIVFSDLKELHLTLLESLTSFSSSSYSFNFPSLEELELTVCPNMKIFSGGELSTPNLHKVKRNWVDEAGCWKGDLNKTIQHLHEAMRMKKSQSLD